MDGGVSQLQYNQSGLFWSGMAGLAVGAGAFLLFELFKAGHKTILQTLYLYL